MGYRSFREEEVERAERAVADQLRVLSYEKAKLKKLEGDMEMAKLRLQAEEYGGWPSDD